MDDAMFAGISTGVKYGNPKSANLIAEPGQVMVLVPGARAEKAESALASIKNTIVLAGAGLLIILALFVIVYMWFFKKRSVYEAKSLPGYSGAFGGPLAGPLAGPPAVHAVSAPDLKPVKIPVDVDDIVSIPGDIPIWTVPEETETKVSEADNGVAALVRARESLSKVLETPNAVP